MTTCMECGGAAIVVGGDRIYPHRPDLYAKSFWLCDCGAYCGCHPGTITPLGHPCGPETRKARSAAHAAFDPMWKGENAPMRRSQAYRCLAKEMGIAEGECHIGMMNATQAREVVRVVSTWSASRTRAPTERTA